MSEAQSIFVVDEWDRRDLLHRLTKFVAATNADRHMTIKELAADLMDAEPIEELLADSPVDTVWGYEFPDWFHGCHYEPARKAVAKRARA